MQSYISRYRALEKGFYAKGIERIGQDDAARWLSDRFFELPYLTDALMRLLHEEFGEAWGPPGAAGSPERINETCSLFSENCKELLRWEEKVRFSRLPEEWFEVHKLMEGVGGHILAKVTVVSEELANLMERAETGPFEIKVVVDMPKGWQERFEKAMQECASKLNIESFEQ